MSALQILWSRTNPFVTGLPFGHSLGTLNAVNGNCRSQYGFISREPGAHQRSFDVPQMALELLRISRGQVSGLTIAHLFSLQKKPLPCEMACIAYREHRLIP